ncbi:MAG: methylated-DNA--[protein]-cysteine S-methyltransferase, partial [Syntrophaceae bacterium]|nr:methylated-DNA--[protein]-cysteine S-methyltransferase [Syntrophaceae bacterium]
IPMHRQDNSTNASYRQRVSLPSAVRDCSTNKFQCTSFLKFESHNKRIIKHKPFGSVCIIWSVSKKIPRIVHVLLSRPGLSAEDRAAMLFPEARISSCTEIDEISSFIKDFLEGEDVKFHLDIADLSLCTKFQQSVLSAQHAIRRGSVSTYGLIAAHVGAPGGARAVGNVMAYNPFPLIIPCHRTVLSDLRLGGFQSGAKMKKALLEMEGIIFDEAGRVVCKRLHYSKKK